MTRFKKKSQDATGGVDKRFEASLRKPQFQRRSVQNSNKIELDPRFTAVLTDPRFRVDSTDAAIDKFGRRIKKREDEEGELAAFYTVDDKKSVTAPATLDDTENGEKIVDDRFREAEPSARSDSKSIESDNDRSNGIPEAKVEHDALESRIAYLTALSRGDISVTSSNKDEDDEEEEAEDDSTTTSATSSYKKEEEVGVLHPTPTQLEYTSEPSPYLAVCNMDWTHVRAVDLFTILSSFCPAGSVKWVRVYPSDFGNERLEREEKFGPIDIWNTTHDDDNSDVNDIIENQKEVDSIQGERMTDDLSKKLNGKEKEGRDDDTNEEFNKMYKHYLPHEHADQNLEATDFDPEKLRAYEASKLLYYFAVAEFSSPDTATIAYKAVDGLEVGHSSANVDLRSIPPSDLAHVTEGRIVRDEASAIPSNYQPPDFVVNALQHSTVKCTWEDGEEERRKRSINYGVGNETWNALMEGDDLKAYLASDVSFTSSEEDETQPKKGLRVRKLLGLDSEDEADAASSSQGSVDSSSSSDEGSKDDEENDVVKQVTFVPGKPNLQDKIRSKLEAKNESKDHLSPWEKYQLKRKEKRKERKQAAKKKKNGASDSADIVMHSDDDSNSDEFFTTQEDSRAIQNNGSKKSRKDVSCVTKKEEEGPSLISTKEELELLFAGDNEEEEAKDYDMRGLLRIEKNKDKKLRGARKRKEAKIVADISVVDFKMDTTDTRFAPLLNGLDARFGIDKTDPSYKDTPAMRQVLAEQSKRRRQQQKRKRDDASLSTNIVAAADTNATSKSSSGNQQTSTNTDDQALSLLVKSVKSKVALKQK